MSHQQILCTKLLNALKAPKNDDTCAVSEANSRTALENKLRSVLSVGSNPLKPPPGLIFKGVISEPPGLLRANLTVPESLTPLHFLHQPAVASSITPPIQLNIQQPDKEVGEHPVEQPPMESQINILQVKKVGNHRINLAGIGELNLTMKNNKVGTQTSVFEGYKMRPGNPVFCSWSLDGEAAKGKQLALGLYRYGCQSNEQSIVTRKLDASKIESNKINGEMCFFAPKSAGQFVFRIFDARSTLDTLATSKFFNVVLMDSDILQNLEHAMEAFNDSPLKAVSLLGLILKSIRNNSNSPSEVKILIDKCVSSMLKLIIDSIPIIDEGYNRKKLLKSGDLDETGNECSPFEDPESIDKKASVEADADFWKSYRTMLKLQSECNDTISVLIQSKTSWYLVSKQNKDKLKEINSLFCPFLKRYFASAPTKVSARIEHLGFNPYSSRASSEIGIQSFLLEDVLSTTVSGLMPSPGFMEFRNTIRTRIEKIVLSCSSIDPRSRLEIYGSSANNFGNSSGDIDMCLITPTAMSVEERGLLHENLIEVLTRSHMRDIKSILTARVPIIQFYDPDSKMNIDISLQNTLAVYNTKLLRAYSRIDPRTRMLVFLVKNWAKLRGINSPQNGTLSSYGYVLSVIHFLQHRYIPILPNLQVVNSSSKLEKSVINPIDGTTCDVSFQDPTEDQYIEFQNQAKRNTESIGTLLFEYFRYFAHHFDFKNNILSIRTATGIVAKVEKYEKNCWHHTDKLR